MPQARLTGASFKDKRTSTLIHDSTPTGNKCSTLTLLFTKPPTFEPLEESLLAYSLSSSHIFTLVAYKVVRQFSVAIHT